MVEECRKLRVPLGLAAELVPSRHERAWVVSRMRVRLRARSPRLMLHSGLSVARQDGQEWQ